MHLQPPATREIRHDGLAIQCLDAGRPLFLVPNPQGFVLTPAARSPLAGQLATLGFGLVSFDPPGAFASRRPPHLGLEEMLACCLEALTVAGASAPLDLVAHSQGTIVALAFALRHPQWVRRLVLVGAVSGGVAATRRARGMPWCWRWSDRRLWQFALLGAKLSAGRGSLADYKRLARLFQAASYVNEALVPEVRLELGDERRPGPARAGWQASIRSLDLLPQLGALRAPTLVCVGRHDPQTPVRGNEEIARAIPGARLAVFENSGHSPFVEEPEAFRRAVGDFLSQAH